LPPQVIYLKVTSAGIEQINMAIVQMDQVTQQNAALVEEAAAASASMQDQASGLSRAVGAFKLDNSQASRTAAPAAIGARRTARPLLSA
jgi:hypothetical protein